MTASGAHRESKAREVENLLTISEHHRELWGEITQNRELDRIFESGADVLASPPTVLEEESLNQIFMHFQSTWRIAKVGGLITLKELGADVRGFFNLPLPRAVWEKTKTTRNQRFVKFVDCQIRSGG